jgi:hypothetical protein
VEFLRRSWEGTVVDSRLAAALDTVRAARRLLLPQGAEAEQLLALAWSVLSAADRRATPWTTHLAPGTGTLFRFAMSPHPGEARREQTRPEEWTLLEIDGPHVPPTVAEPGAPDLARAVARGEPAWPDLEEGLEREDWGLSLARDAPQVGRWVAWCALGRTLPRDGFATVYELRSTLEALRLEPRTELRDPWLGPEAVLEAAAATLLRLLGGGQSLDLARDGVAAELRRAALAELVLSPEVVRSLASAAASAPSRADLLAAGVTLAWTETSSGEALGKRQSEELLDLLLSVGPEGPLVQAILEDLASSLLASGSSRAEAVLERLGGVPGALLRVFGQLRSAGLDDLLTLARCANLAGDRATAAALVRDHVVPRLAGPDAARGALRHEQMDWALQTLRRAPEGMVEALRRWDGRSFDLAATVLGRWAREGDPAALAVARSLADPQGAGVRKRGSVLGLAQALLGAGAPTRDWMAFAVAEAAVLDDESDAAGKAPFLGFLRRLEIPPEAAAEVVPAVLRSLAVSGPYEPRGDCHRALLRLVEPGCLAHPTETRRALERLAELPEAEYVEWAGPVASVARRFEEAGRPDLASQIRWQWWQRLGERGWKAFPAAAVEMFGALDLADRQALAGRWKGGLESLGDLPGEEALVAVLGAAAAGDRELSFAFDLARLVREVKAGRMILPEAAARGELLAWRSGRVEERRREVLARLLPPWETERMSAVLGLLLSPKPWQSTKRTLEKEELPKLPRVPSDSLMASLPSVGELAARPLALLAVAEYVGSRWPGNPPRARELLCEALADGHLPYVVRFLSVSEEGWRRSFVQQLEREKDQDTLRRLRRAAESPSGAQITRLVNRRDPSLEA